MLRLRGNPGALGRQALEFVNSHRAITAATVSAILSLSVYASGFSFDECWRRHTHPGYQGNGKYGPTGMYYDEVARGTIPSADQLPETVE